MLLASRRGAERPVRLSSSLEATPGRRRRPTMHSWLFALPAIIALALVLAYPFLANLWTSLHVDRLSRRDGDFIGLQNYADVLSRGDLTGTVGRTLVFTFGSLVLQFVVGFAAALALEQFPRASKVLRPLLIMPWIVPGVAVAAIWLSILNPLAGLANGLLDLVGVAPVEWLGSPTLAMSSLIVVNAWKGFPYWMLMISAGLKTIPGDVIEAARIDGASAPRILVGILVPLLAPVLAATAVLAFIWTFNYFDLVYLMTDGGPGDSTTTLPFAIYESALKFNRFDQSAVFSVLSVGFTTVAIACYFQLNRRRAIT